MDGVSEISVNSTFVIFPPSTDKVTVTGPCIPVEEPVKVFPEAFAVEPAELAHPASIKDAAKSAVKDFSLFSPSFEESIIQYFLPFCKYFHNQKSNLELYSKFAENIKISLQIHDSHLLDSGSNSTGCSLRSSHNVKEKYLFAS